MPSAEPPDSDPLASRAPDAAQGPTTEPPPLPDLVRALECLGRAHPDDVLLAVSHCDPALLRSLWDGARSAAANPFALLAPAPAFDPFRATDPWTPGLPATRSVPSDDDDTDEPEEPAPDEGEPDALDVDHALPDDLLEHVRRRLEPSVVAAAEFHRRRSRGAGGDLHEKHTRALRILASLPAPGPLVLPDLATLRERLDAATFGQDDAKQHVAESLTLLACSQRHGGDAPWRPLLLSGPPGTGKTTFARAVAAALGLAFVVVPVVGRAAYDVGGLSYHWSGASEGALLRALAGLSDRRCVLLLDEIDKISLSRENGSAVDVLLSCLDDRRVLHDAFVHAAVDVSSVLFVATANDRAAVHPALFDRFDHVSLTPYTADELRVIVARHTFPSLVTQVARPGAVLLDDGAVDLLVRHCTARGGARAAQGLCARVLAAVADRLGPEAPPVVVDAEAVRGVLGDPPSPHEPAGGAGDPQRHRSGASGYL